MLKNILNLQYSDERFPGSALASVLKDKQSEFSEYLLFDEDEESINVLKIRILKLRTNIGSKSIVIEKKNLVNRLKRFNL